MANIQPDQTSRAETTDQKQFRGQLAALGSLTPELFDAHVGELFRIEYLPVETEQTHVNPRSAGNVSTSDPPVSVELKLVEVTRYPKLKEREGGFDHRARAPFSLLLEGPDDPVLMSAGHTVHHDQLGTGWLFLNPVQVTLKPQVEKQSGVRFYEVVFG